MGYPVGSEVHLLIISTFINTEAGSNDPASFFVDICQENRLKKIRTNARLISFSPQQRTVFFDKALNKSPTPSPFQKCGERTCPGGNIVFAILQLEVLNVLVGIPL